MISREQSDELSVSEVATVENPSCCMDLSMQASLSPTYNLDTIYDQVVKVLSTPEKVFPFIDIKSAERTGSLAKLKALPMMSTLVEFFRKAGFEAQIGYNVSSSDISLTLNVKVLLQPLRVALIRFLFISGMRMTLWSVSKEESAAACR
jgi:hypothetical protein